jgi:hypothetical protein
MSDRRLRDLERRWNETGSAEARKAYDRELKRVGAPPLPRLVIRHYVASYSHGHCGPDGLFDINYTGGGCPIQQDRIHAACSVELWPRNLLAESRGWQQTMKKDIHYTEDPEEVTCKTCLRSINKPVKRVYKRTHYSPGARLAIEDDVNERTVVPLCGRDDSKRFEETFSYNMGTVNCPACRRIMNKGKRRPRRPLAKK